MWGTTMSNTKVIVIGGGPGGYVAAIRAAQLGAEVTLIEEKHIGGTCLNVGCIPTKALLSSAHAMGNAARAESLGVEMQCTLHWEQVQKHREQIISKLVGGVESMLRANRIKILRGRAHFGDSTTVLVDGEGTQTALKADRILIAAGSEPLWPAIPGIDNSFCINSTQALRLEAVPKSMIIVGGGVIGVEFATAYSRFGAEITIVEMADSLLPGMDRTAAERIKDSLQADGVRVCTGAQVLRFEAVNGQPTCFMRRSDGGEESAAAEKILICVGRRPNLRALDLDKAGIHWESYIKTDDMLRTNVDNIYAVGDCNGILLLASAAMAQGRIAADNCMGAEKRFDKALCPRTVFSQPELSEIGLNEEQLKERNIEFETGFFPSFGNGRSVVEGVTEGFVKLLIGKEYGEILGASVFLPQANELIHTIAAAMQAEATVDELTAMPFAHPVLSECISEAALASQGIAIHIPNKKRKS